MLIPCPECERQVSDRAKACPDCGFPVADHVAEQKAEADRVARMASRTCIGEIDCPSCDARGFRTFDAPNDHGVMRELFEWCAACKHGGRVHQCQDLVGFYAVSHAALELFLAGSIDAEHEGVWFVGSEPASDHRYPQPQQSSEQSSEQSSDHDGEQNSEQS